MSPEEQPEKIAEKSVFKSDFFFFIHVLIQAAVHRRSTLFLSFDLGSTLNKKEERAV